MVHVTELYFSFITESPRWLIMKGKTKEAIKILEKVAKTNGKITVLCEDGINLKKEQRLSFTMFVRKLLNSKTLMYRLIVMSFTW